MAPMDRHLSRFSPRHRRLGGGSFGSRPDLSDGASLHGRAVHRPRPGAPPVSGDLVMTGRGGGCMGSTATGVVHIPGQTWRRRLTRNWARERASDALTEAISSFESFL